MSEDLQSEMRRKVYESETYAMIAKHNKKLLQKHKKQFALEKLNYKMKLFVPAAYEKIPPGEKKTRREGQVKIFIEDQQRQLQRRKGKPPNSTWMFV